MYISNLHNRRKSFLPFKLFVILLSVLTIIVLSFERFVKVAAPFAESKAHFIAIDIINLEVSRYIKDNPSLFDNIITVKTHDGYITYAGVESSKVNTIKSELTGRINSSLSQEREYTLGIPMANLLGITLLSGIGVPLKLKIHPVSRVEMNFKNSFTSEGINQTHLFLSLDIKVRVMIVIPGLRKSAEVTTSIPLGETVFLGQVPQQYTNLGEGKEYSVSIE
ncbi:MAG: sporulation protein YunB [Clostridia bacterium]|nr:sporulation protein YunB [Clostridia bacterium]